MFEVSNQGFSRLALISFLFPIALNLSCGSSATTASAIDSANNYLTNGDCSDALSAILPIYNSSSSTNQVRLVTASAYGCDADVDFFQVLTNLGLDSNTLSSASLLGYLAQIFPSTTADKVVESGGYGMEVLLTTLTPGEVIAPVDSINSTSNNPGSLLYSDRIDDSNLYMLMMSMAVIGGSASRYSSATGYHPANTNMPFPWVNNTSAMTTDGCTLAAAVVNFVDVLDAEANVITGSAGTQLQTIEGLINSTTLDQACTAGCTGASLPLPHWQASGCTLTDCGNSGHCPLAIRDWNQCKLNSATDPVGCAAAGIINLLNTGILWI